MRSFAKAALSVAVVAFAASISLAQGGRPGGQQMEGPVLLLNKSVQDELKLTDDQKADLKKVRDKMTEGMQKAFTDNPGKDGKEKRDAAVKEITEDTTKSVTKTIDSLKDDQKKRFKQIQIQIKGLRAFTDEDVAKSLKLTDKQKDEIKTQADDLQKDVRELMTAAGRDPEKRTEAQKKAAELTTKATDKVTSGLSDEQKKTWKELTGDKFDYKPEPFPGGGGKKGGDKSF